MMTSPFSPQETYLMRMPRVWFAVLLLLVTALPTSADDATKRDDAAAEKLGLKLSLQCWTFNKLTFFEAVDKAARLGVKYVEAFPGQKVRPDAKDTMSPNMS